MKLSMIQLTAKLSSLIFFVQSAIAAPAAQSETTRKLHHALMLEVKTQYDKASGELKKSGLKAFIANFGDDLSDFDQAFLSKHIKGLHPLPEVVLGDDGVMQMTNLVAGKNQPIKIEVADIKNRVVLINGKMVKVDGVDSLEDVYKKVNEALGQTKVASTWHSELSELFVRQAHAIETSTIIAGAIIAVSIAVIAYQLGKNAGENKYRDALWMQKIQNGKGGKGNKDDISEENPVKLENPGTDSQDQSTDVVTPGH
ncbi:MAG TPA: hypothetical protein VM901_04875 [Bdellovibrionota bacterium]|jgi:hypothetical protein|nr:hypothetical protein [Bdellovibrionota bacterium]